jgi:hypothetical protein
MHPEWAKTGSGYDIATRQCWAYCKQQKAGVVLLVDRSPSTQDNAVRDEKTNKIKYLYRLIPEAVYKLRIPDGIKTAFYRHDKDTDEGFKVNRVLQYGKNSQSLIDKARKYIDTYIYRVSDTSFKMAITDVVDNKIDVNKIDEDYISNNLDTRDIPDPDLLIRPGGEVRISNYLLWQLAYAEMYFTDAFWPDFDEKELVKAIEYYNTKERRYGNVK